MKKQYFFLLIVPMLLLGCKGKKPVEYVDPFIGTGFHGHTYPGATAPFGAVQLSPDTRRGNWDACSGYHFSDSTLLGFSHTHLSGTGCIDLGDILFHPMTDEIKNRPTGYIFDPIPFSHKNEAAEPGYYKVLLGNDILAELTATTHVGVHRYTFPEKGTPKIVIDMAHLLDNEKIKEAKIQAGSGEITGMRCTKGWVDNQYIYFVAQFSTPFDAQFISNGKVVTGAHTLKGENIQAVLSFAKSQGKPVVVKVGISSVSIENARLNLQTEIKDFNFDKIKFEAKTQWDKVLSVYQVAGATNDEMTIFYTALYHTMVTPNVISDVNGQYRGADMKIRNANGRKVYSTFSIWDTFRAWNPLMTLTDTTFVNNTINSFLNFYDQTGELPIWPLASGETGTMIGYHAVSVIYDAYSKNIRGFNAEKAFQAMKVSADKNKKGTTPYLALGFIPADSKRESVSCLLENAYDDWCIAQMAKALGHTADYNRFIVRAKLYKNVFDGNTGFFHGRLRDGLWENPFDPMEAGRAYTEATAWQYRFFALHDVKGMVNLLGGETVFANALDSLFTVTSSKKVDFADITGMVGQYAHGNEPSHHMAYLYNYVGQPWKTQKMVRRLLKEMYLPTPAGLIGNEDCGQMSAWYVLSSLGLYSVCPGSTQFVLTSPLFENANIRLPNGKTLTITANHPSRNIYIKEVYWNDKLLNENYITYSKLMEGGHLKFVLDDEPNLKRGISPESYPYSLSEKAEVSIPFISNDISFFVEDVAVKCGSATKGAEIRYTLDGSEPTVKSLCYNVPFVLKNSAQIKLKAFRNGFTPSPVSVYTASKAVFHQSATVNLKANGIHYQYFEGTFNRTSEIVQKGKLVKTGTCDTPTLKIAQIPDNFGIIFTGYIYTPVDGVYLFSNRSDDGSLLRIDNLAVVDNDGSHAEVRAMGRIALKKGFHSYELLYFQGTEDKSLSFDWIIPGKMKEESVEAKYLFVK